MILTTLALQVVVIMHATIIDPDSPTVRADQAVVVRGSRIERVGPSATVRPPDGARVIDATGKYLIPGMWDMHVHVDVTGGRPLLGLFVAAGVTGVRDMNGDLARLRGWQREIAAGTLAGPRMVVSGPYITGRASPLPHLLALTPAEGERAVDSLARIGVDFIKVHNRLSPETSAAIGRAAERHGMVVAGHVSLPLSPLDAARSGVRSEEHLYAFPNWCSPADSAVIAGATELQQYVMGRCTSEPQAAMYAALAREQTWITPTLGVQQGLAELRVPIVRRDSTAQYYSDALLERLAEEFELPPAPPAAAVAAGQRLFERRLALVGALHRAGVRLLGGTDSPLTVGGPGASLVGELEWLVRAGLTPREALRTVTTEPARYFAADSLGSVSAGRVADLVLLDADPLADVANVRRIALVVSNGRLFEARDLERLRVDARRAAR
ncbi:MAG: amidohydrolase family protein [Gemmatimonadaceae bacterium]|nr:amidohydrolase family protein [Gemmatimonadaceae bacterium]